MFYSNGLAEIYQANNENRNYNLNLSLDFKFHESRDLEFYPDKKTENKHIQNSYGQCLIQSKHSITAW